MSPTPTLPPTPGQTVGPFYGYALPYAGDSELVPPGRPDAIRLHGTVLDGHGDPVPDALLEVWQADEQGRVRREPGSLHRDGFTFTGWGRASTDLTGHYSFTTVAPGPTEDGAAPFFAITVFARGLLNRLFTRAYLPGHPALDTDRVLTSLPADRRETLIGTAVPEGLRFDIRLQGERETVFLSYPGQDAHRPPHG
jgi:protocatechuate 3,4-dioxygenase alpha subunit